MPLKKSRESRGQRESRAQEQKPVELESDILVGGQALIEGVMMKAGDRIGIAVRKAGGKIKLRKEKVVLWTKKHTLLGLPFVRGFFNMVQLMVVGTRAIIYAAEEAAGKGQQKEGFRWYEIWPMMLFSVLIAIAIFKFVPFFFSGLLTRGLAGVEQNSTVFGVIEGIIKLALLLGYLKLISLMPDIRRVFEYHGAEHKTVFCYEKKLQLTAANVKRQSRFHPRCGTSFIVGVVAISIIIYILLPNTLSFWQSFTARLLLLPVIAGVSYEMLRITSKRQDSAFFKAITKPGLWTQRITTGEPDRKQIEVAIEALRVALGEKKVSAH